MERTVVIGDVGGHLGVFEEALRRSGVDPQRGVVPEGVQVVQVGDLLHKGPASRECVELADRLLRRSPGRYVQLLGNHEAHYLGGPRLSGRAGVVEVETRTQLMLQEWQEEGMVSLACAARTLEHGDVLLTHAGLTRGLWAELGKPQEAAEAARRVNTLALEPDRAYRSGWLLTGEVNEAAGVLYARTGTELIAPWLRGGDLPWTQIHGHEGAWWWRTNTWHEDVPPEVRESVEVDFEQRWSRSRVRDRLIWSIDWVLGEEPPEREWEPLVLEGRLLDLESE